MQTQCPHCATRFRVTESQVNTADGYVRCSVCKQVFNAIEVAEADERQPSLLSQAHSTDGIDTSNNVTLDDLELSSDDPVDRIVDEPPGDTEIESIDFNETSATDGLRKDAFDFFDEKSNESLSHVVPEKFKDTYNSGSSVLVSSLLWGVGTLLLTATLLIEYAWFNRDRL